MIKCPRLDSCVQVRHNLLPMADPIPISRTTNPSPSNGRLLHWGICVLARCQCNTTSVATPLAGAKPTRPSNMDLILRSVSAGVARVRRSSSARRMWTKSKTNWPTTTNSAFWLTSGDRHRHGVVPATASAAPSGGRRSEKGRQNGKNPTKIPKPCPKRYSLMIAKHRYIYSLRISGQKLTNGLGDPQ